MNTHADVSNEYSEDKAGGSANKKVEGTWAEPVHHLETSDLPKEAINLNVSGRHLSGPVHGFGQLWQKTYRVKMGRIQASPQEIIRIWKENFPSFWPKGNFFYSRLKTITPGDVVVLNLAGPGGISAPGGRPMISTGVMVIYADEESFSFMTPEGHMLAGMITFSAYEDETGIVAQAQALVRANDPIYELSFRLGFGHRSEDQFWIQTLKNLAAYFGVGGEVSREAICIDSKMQWAEARNIWHNAAVRTGLYLGFSPFRWALKRMRKRDD